MLTFTQKGRKVSGVGRFVRNLYYDLDVPDPSSTTRLVYPISQTVLQSLSLRGFEAMRQWSIRSRENLERGPRGLNPSRRCPSMALTLARHGVALLQAFSRTIGGFESVNCDRTCLRRSRGYTLALFRWLARESRQFTSAIHCSKPFSGYEGV